MTSDTPTEDTPSPEGATVIRLVGKDQRRSDSMWSKPVMARGYTIVPALLIRGQHRLGLSPLHLNVLLQLISHWWGADGKPFPSVETIAGRMDKSVRQVQRYLGELETAGFIQRIGRFQAGRGQTSNEFDLSGLVRKLQAIEPEFRKLAEEMKARRSSIERRGGKRSTGGS